MSISKRIRNFNKIADPTKRRWHREWTAFRDIKRAFGQNSREVSLYLLGAKYKRELLESSS